MDAHTKRIETYNNLKHTKNQAEWEECVNIRESDLYKGIELDDALDIMELLDEFYDKLNALIDSQGHSGMSYSVCKSIIKHFHICENTIDDF